MNEPVRIPLTQGKYAIVSPEDAEEVMKYKWYARKERTGIWYAVRMGLNRKIIYMHREIVKPSYGMFVDHVDDDGLNNTRTNLRECTNSQNCANGRMRKNNSGYRGVHHRKERKRSPYIANIRVNYRLYHLGSYSNPEEAAQAYDEAALAHFGEFARLNFPNEVRT